MHDLHKQTALFTAIAAIFSAVPVLAATPDSELPEVVVIGTVPGTVVMNSTPAPTPKSTVGKAGIDLLGGPGQTSLYAPVDLMPSVLVESPDPYGLSPNRNVNIRGKGDFHMTRNVEGLPLTGIVGGTDLFDLENIEQVDLYRGGLAAGQGLGISNASGAIDQKLLAPRERFGVAGKQTFGSFDFRRSFVRFDSGTLAATGTKLFISASTAGGDKWTGAGDLSRHNAMVGISQPLGERVRIDLDLVYNKFEGDSYRSLSYAQTQALDSNYHYDYNAALTGKAATDVNFHQFNRSSYENFGVIGKVDVALAEGQHLAFKPYYWKDNGVQYSASGANVQIWNQRNDNVGAVLEYQGHYGAGTDVVAGYWFQSMEPPPPPTDQTKYTVTADGGLAFASWATLAKIDRFVANSPYLQLNQTWGDTVLSGGVRYMDLGAPRMQYYKTAGLPKLSYDQIWSVNPVADSNASGVAAHYREWLPNLGLRRQLAPQWSAGVSYGRKFGRPDWGPQASNYISNEAAFVAKGISLQTLLNRVRPELSDQLDLSAQYDANGLALTATVFASKNQNRQVLVTDPALAGLSYYQGTAKTTGRGAELEANYQLGSAWTAFGSATLSAETYDGDTPALAGGTAMATDGKQIPNAPKTMLKAGLVYRWSSLSVAPVARHIGKRYGDSVEAQPVPAYTLLDLNLGYDLGRNARLGLTVLNMFDRRYISQISPNDTNLNGATAYYAGAPRSYAMTLSAKF